MIVAKTSPFTGKEHTMDMPTVTQERLERCWKYSPTGEGKHIQDEFPELSADEREFLISGVSPDDGATNLYPALAAGFVPNVHCAAVVPVIDEA